MLIIHSTELFSEFLLENLFYLLSEKGYRISWGKGEKEGSVNEEDVLSPSSITRALEA